MAFALLYPSCALVGDSGHGGSANVRRSANVRFRPKRTSGGKSMQVGNPSLSLASRCAIALLAVLSIGPVVTGLDLLFHFLPTSVPAMENLHTASTAGQAIWGSAGVLGVAAILVVLRWPVPAVVACFAFAATYILGANAVWRHFTFGCWLAIATVVLSAIAAYAGSRQVRALR